MDHSSLPVAETAALTAQAHVRVVPTKITGQLQIAPETEMSTDISRGATDISRGARHNPAWHAEYLRLENAATAASEELRCARRLLDRKRPPVGAQAAYDAALDKARETGAARWEFEMAATKIVDTRDVSAGEFFATLGAVR